MVMVLILVFVVGYFFIAMESSLKVNKAAFALLMCGLLWAVYMLFGRQGVDVTASQAVSELGSTCETLIFLIGAMSIVTLIDKHDGFSVLTKAVHSGNRVGLLWFICLATFACSALLDNMTTTIIMVMMTARPLSDRYDICLFTAMIIISANAGGAWSPIGDVTTIMLWMHGNVTSSSLVGRLLAPSLISMLVPLIIVSRHLSGKPYSSAVPHSEPVAADPSIRVSRLISGSVQIIGILGLLSVPFLKELCGLPPYLSVMLSLGVIWIITDLCYNSFRRIDERYKNRVSVIVKEIDMPTILFFFGILMAVGALQSAGILSRAADSLSSLTHNEYLIGGLIGAVSSVVDNVPIVAACMGMYPVVSPAEIAAAADPAFMASFAQDGLFWNLICYCAGTGGSLLIIGSAAGVVAMGLQNISFGWYLRNITPLAAVGYLSGIAVIFLESLVL